MLTPHRNMCAMVESIRKPGAIIRLKVRNSMAGKISKAVTPEQQKRTIVEEAWLKYYNQVLFEKDMITERERNLMISKIDARTTRRLSR